MKTAQNLTKRVITIHRDAGVLEAADLMADEAVGCLVVVDDDERAVGILTDRDLVVRVLATHCPEQTFQVSQVMTQPVVSLPVDSSVEDFKEEMRTMGIRRIPAVLDGRPVGVISIDDLLQVLAGELSDLSEAAWAELRSERRAARFHRVESDLRELTQRIYGLLQYGSWRARESFLSELDELRERLGRTASGED